MRRRLSKSIRDAVAPRRVGARVTLGIVPRCHTIGGSVSPGMAHTLRDLPMPNTSVVAYEIMRPSYERDGGVWYEQSNAHAAHACRLHVANDKAL
jgi:hypothetical protein